MTPDQRTAEIQQERHAEPSTTERTAQRRAFIMESPHAQRRFALALSLASKPQVCIDTAVMALQSAPEAMSIDQTDAWLSRFILPPSDAQGAIHGH